jgi:2-iminobutanoate/2-iminopropanoate deaminase
LSLHTQCPIRNGGPDGFLTFGTILFTLTGEQASHCRTNAMIAEEKEMTSTRQIETAGAPAAIGPYAQGRVGGNMIFVSGQLGLDPRSGEFAGEDLDAQARQALANMQAILQAGGCRLTDVAAVDVFLADMGHFVAFNLIYEEFFGGHKPARAVVAVKTLPKNGLVEVKCIAIRRE